LVAAATGQKRTSTAERRVSSTAAAEVQNGARLAYTTVNCESDL